MKRFIALTILPTLFIASAATAQMGGAPAKPSIILVHGAFADASGWGRVITALEKDGYTVTAVQNPLTSFADDVATTKRLIDAQTGNVVVVAHSYGGAVMTAAAAGNTKVKALVYIAALGPGAGEVLGPLLEKFPNDVGKSFRPDAAGFVYIDRAAFHDVFCADVAKDEAAVMAAAQKPLHGSAFGGSVETPAWKTIPAWYIVASDDKVINPELERFMAKRMNATTSELKSSHVPFISKTNDVVKVIVAAAKSVK
jgi:pimeloyl-ACP methyl ester carboxylesterase